MTKMNQKHYEIQVDLQKMTALKLLAGKDDIRYYLNGVCVEATVSETRLLATNGHMAGMVRNGGFEGQTNVMDDDGFVMFTVPNDVLDKINWKAGKLAPLATILVDSWEVPTPEGVGDEGPGIKQIQCVLRTVDGATYPFSALDGKFPDIRRVMPWGDRTEQGIGAQINPVYIAAFDKFAKLYTVRKTANLRLGYAGPNNVVQVLVMGAPDFIGCVMPIRDADDATPVAQWPAPGADVPATVAE